MVKGFKFKLQKILDIRIEEENKRARIFKAVQNEKLQVEEKLKELEESYLRYSEVGTEETVAYQKIKRIYIQNILKAIEDTKVELNLKERELSLRREEAKKSQIGRKTVESLKEKKYENFKKEQERIEKVFNDELALYSYIRKNERG